MSFRCDLLDAAIAEQVLKALQPAEIELALAALQELSHAIGPSRANGRCGSNVPSMKPRSPSGAIKRSILPNVWSATLERRWNEALLQLEDLKNRPQNSVRSPVTTDEQRAKVLALATDLPRLWHAPTTQAKDRKRMLRLLIKDITVEKPPNLKQLLVTSGGRAAPAVTLACNSRPIELTACGILPRLSTASEISAKACPTKKSPTASIEKGVSAPWANPSPVP